MTPAAVLGEIAASRRRITGAGAGAYFTAASALSPTSHWKLDEPSGVFADSFGGKDLTLGGSATRNISTGLTGVGNGVNFTPANQGWARVGASLAAIGSNGFSVCGWVYDNATPDAFQMPWVCISQAAGHSDPYYTFFLGGNGTNYRYAVGISTFSPVDTGVAFFATGGWHHLAFTWNRSTADMKLYLDAAQVHTTTRTGTPVGQGSFALNNIPALNANTYAASARYAQWSYWSNTVLSGTDISSLYAAR